MALIRRDAAPCPSAYVRFAILLAISESCCELYSHSLAYSIILLFFVHPIAVHQYVIPYFGFISYVHLNCLLYPFSSSPHRIVSPQSPLASLPDHDCIFLNHTRYTYIRSCIITPIYHYTMSAGPMPPIPPRTPCSIHPNLPLHSYHFLYISCPSSSGH